MSELHIRELRRAAQQIFMGIIALSDDRKEAQELTHDVMKRLKLKNRVHGHKGEVVENLEEAVQSALDEIKNITLAAPKE
jgi:hypothetical protein